MTEQTAPNHSQVVPPHQSQPAPTSTPHTEDSGLRVKSCWRARLRGTVKWSALIAALAYPVVSLLSRTSWLADLLCHHRVPGVLSAVVACAATTRRHRRLALGLALLAVWESVPLFDYSGKTPVAADPVSRERFKILLSNVLFYNENPQALADLIRDEKPDAVAIIETSPETLVALQSVAPGYPFRMDSPRGANGISLWFRSRPKTLEPPHYVVADRNAVIHATFEFAGKKRHFWAVHPTSPMRRPGEPGNPELQAIAKEVGATNGSRIVAGDMNSTEASALFRDFVRDSGLRDSRLGFGRQPSWPTFSFYRIPIDHVFVSDDLAVVERRLGPGVGSDHLPVIVVLAPAAVTSAASDAAHGSQSRGSR